MSDDKPLPAHRQAARDWVDAIFALKAPLLLAEMYRRAETSRANGFKRGHAPHKRKAKDSDDDERE